MIDLSVGSGSEKLGKVDRIVQVQSRILTQIMSEDRAKRMIDIEARAEGKGDVYSLSEMLEDVRSGIWTELVDRRSTIDPYRRSLQRTYVQIMTDKIKGETPSTSDMRPLARGELQEVSSLIDRNKGRINDRTTRLHLEDIQVMIQQALKIE
ncbi:zinc-dependent metalloprotease [candidate division KSB1 bacterium]|nr:zinc-dependent metalloprotease [candidate division KSB1 bacterium]